MSERRARQPGLAYWLAQSAVATGVGLAIGLLIGGLAILVLLALLTDIIPSSSTWLAVVAGANVLVLLLGLTAVYLYRQQRREVELAHRARERVAAQAAELQSEMVRAELKALRSQINPHFLFNTLNTIAALIPENPQSAEEAVISLSELLRGALARSDAAQSTLGEEIDFVERYLALESQRFGGRLRVAWRVDPALRACRVPPFALQPLVENAVKYAVAPREAGGELAITAERRGGRLLLSVEDDGPGPPPGGLAQACRCGTGLANLQRRLEGIYGDRAELALSRCERGGCRAAVELPCPERPSEEVR